MSAMKRALLLWACAFALNGCGDPESATPPLSADSQPTESRDRSGAEFPPSPIASASTSTGSEATSPDISGEAPASESFEAKFAEAKRLQDAGEIRSAIILVRMMQMAFAEHDRARKLVALERELGEQRELEASMAVPLRNLGSEDAETVRIARRMLRRGGSAVMPLLRRVARHDEGKAGLEATLLLADLDGETAAPLLVERYRADPQGPDASVLIAAIGRGADATDPAFIAEQHRAFVVAPSQGLADILIAFFVNRTDRDAKQYNELVADPRGFHALKSYVGSHLKSGDQTSAAWASNHTQALRVERRGLRARFYSGTDFQKLVAEKLVDRPHIPAGKYPLQSAENISVKWTGMIQINKPGKYTFFSTSDDGQRVFIDGHKVVDDWRRHAPEEHAGSIELASGRHAFEAHFMQGSGPYVYQLRWEGPGIKKQDVPASVFFTQPWGGME